LSTRYERLLIEILSYQKPVQKYQDFLYLSRNRKVILNLLSDFHDN